MRICVECHNTKFASEFYTDSSGYEEKKCKACRLARKHLLSGSRPVLRKECKNCGVTKPSSEFNNDSKSIDGKQCRCKPCRKMERVLHKYGLSKERYDLMLWAQDNRCVICTTEFSDSVTPVVDHCHNTGEVRGLLCSNCNTALGLFKDNVDRLQKAIQYLARNTCRPLLEEPIQC